MNPDDNGPMYTCETSCDDQYYKPLTANDIANIGNSGDTLYYSDGTLTQGSEHVYNHIDGDMEITGDLTISGENIGETLKALKERFLILEEDFQKHRQYPALKKAYDQYKLIESLLK